MSKANLILLRHGQSQWNLENRFTGWIDVDLSQKGREEALRAGEKIKNLALRFERAHTSRLMRAQKTLDIVLQTINQRPTTWVDSALNERHYGDLQGMNKDEVRKKYGEEQVHIWRRSYDQPPPNGECLADTAKRSIPYYREYILKDLMAGKNVLVAAHGNSLRSIVMFIKGMSSEEILKFEMDTGIPYHFEVEATGALASMRML